MRKTIVALRGLFAHTVSVPSWVMPVLVGVVVSVGSFLRLSSLGYPAKRVFDEVYFPNFAAQYLRMQEVYDVHPPLGKFIISVGIWLFGDSSFGWRIVPALLGIVLVLVIGLVVWNATKSALAASVALVLASLDGFLIVYSRTSLMDGILVLAILAVILSAQMVRGRLAPYYIGLALGVAFAIKWPAIAVALLIPFFRSSDDRKMRFVAPLVATALTFYTAVVVLGQWIGGSSSGKAQPFMAALEWHFQAASYHATITATHPWGSPWWSWPLGQRPVLFLYDQVPGGMQVVNTVGNPMLSWMIIIAVIVMSVVGVWRLFSQRQSVQSLLSWWKWVVTHPVTPWLVGYFVFWLPWALVSRVLFHYHYLPSYVFGMMLVSYGIAWLWHHQNRAIAVLIFLVLVLVAVQFLPFAVSWWTQSLEQLQALTWIPSWLSAHWIW